MGRLGTLLGVEIQKRVAEQTSGGKGRDTLVGFSIEGWVHGRSTAL